MANIIIWGCVNDNGTPYKGSGYTSRLEAGQTGFYTIYFGADPPPNNKTPFLDMPAIVIQENWKDWNDWNYTGGNTKDNAVLVACDAGHFQVKTGDGNGDASNRNFTFIAIGPG